MFCNIPEFFRVNGKPVQPSNFKDKINSGAKIHALKLDQAGYYKPGAHIVLCHSHRYSTHDVIQEIEVVSTQEVEFRYDRPGTPDVYIDGRRLGIMEIFALAANEGFDTEFIFFQIYNKSKKFKLIHWTEYRYDGNAARLQAVNDHHAAVNKMNPEGQKDVGGIHWSVEKQGNDFEIKAEGGLMLPSPDSQSPFVDSGEYVFINKK